MRRLQIEPSDRILPAHTVAGPAHLGRRAESSPNSFEAMLAYDLIGFQTVEDRLNFEDYLPGSLASCRRRHGRIGAGRPSSPSSRSASTSMNSPTRAHQGDCAPELRVCVKVCRRQARARRRPARITPRASPTGCAPFDRLLRDRAVLEARSVAAADRGAARAAASGLIVSSRPNSRLSSATSMDATARSTGCRSAISTRVFAAHARRLLSHGQRRPGHAAARRHESRRQGICRRAEPVRSRRAGAVVVRRRRQGARRGAPGQSARHRRHGTRNRGWSCHERR